MSTSRPAVFLDRDGTIIHDAAYIKDPRQVELLPGAAEGLLRLQEAGYALIVVTNQSGIGRGFFKEKQYEAVRDRLDTLLAKEGVRLTASYHCPHHPDVDGPCDCRKPGRLLFERAIVEHDLDAGNSFAIGDRWRDLAPAIALGARGILVPIDNTPDADVAEALAGAVIAKDFTLAVSLVLSGTDG